MFKGSLQKSPSAESIEGELAAFNDNQRCRSNPTPPGKEPHCDNNGLCWLTSYGLDLSQSIIFSNNPDIIEREVSERTIVLLL